MKEKSAPFRWLTDNWGLKLASVMLAAILWFLVTNINDPVIPVTFANIPVTLRNASVLTDVGQVYEVLEGSDNITNVTVTAPRSVAESFTKDNIQAVADFSELTSRDTVPIRLSVNKSANDVVSIVGSIEDVRLLVEDRKTRTIALSVETSGQLAEGYIVGDVVSAQNLVRISGAASRVDKVATAVAEVDVTGFTSRIQTEADVRLYDAEGNLIRDTLLAQNINSVSVQVSILQTKTVPVRVQITGTPAEGYLTTGEVNVTPAEVEIAGTGSVFEGVDELLVRGEETDITGLREDVSEHFALSALLPSGVVLTNPEESTVQVTVGIAPAVTVPMEVPYSRVTLENMPEDVQYGLPPVGEGGEEETLSVSLTGLAESIDTLEPSEIVLRVDVSAALAAYGDNPPGTLRVPAQVTLPADVRAAGAAEVVLVRMRQ